MAVANDDETGWPPGYDWCTQGDALDIRWYTTDGLPQSQSVAHFKDPETARRDAWLDYHKRNGDAEPVDTFMDTAAYLNPAAPKHYTDGGIETIDYIRAKMKPGAFACYCRGNVLKYASRAGKKGPAIEDVRKLEDYARWWREALEAE